MAEVWPHGPPSTCTAWARTTTLALPLSTSIVARARAPVLGWTQSRPSIWTTPRGSGSLPDAS
eukprot:10078403-Lingulodinium_polyedra.AAC.1